MSLIKKYTQIICQFLLLIFIFSIKSFGQTVNLYDLIQFKKQLSVAPLYKIKGNISSNLMYTNGTNLGVNNTVLWSGTGNLDLTIFNKIYVPVSLNLSTAGIGYILP